MLKNKIGLIILVLLMVSGCSVLPFKVGIDDGNFRFENFKDDRGAEQVFIGLMCHKKRLIGWELSKQYLAGEHNLWILVSTNRKGIINSNKETILHLKVDLAERGNYILKNKNISENEMSVWIEDVDTHQIVSPLMKAVLKSPLNNNYEKKKNMCETGTI